MKSIYNKNKIRKFGEQFEDRSDSYDDTDDLYRLIGLTKTHDELRNRFRDSHFPECDARSSITWKIKPFGKYDVDLGILNKETGKYLVLFDTERLSQWGADWPHYYKWLHFFGRKTKFLERRRDVPFYICFLNNDRTKVLILEREIIEKYDPVGKYFKRQQMQENVREIPLSEGIGNLYGKGFGELDLKHFDYGGSDGF